MSAANQDKMSANAEIVWRYLTRAFPYKRVEVLAEPEPERRADRGFRIFDRHRAYFLNVPYEFLADYDAAAITDYLQRWDVAQLLRDAEQHQVTVLKDEPPITAD